jgi:hypothetical protein
MQRLVSQGFSLLLCLALGSPVLAQGRKKAAKQAPASPSAYSWLRTFGGPSVDCGYSVESTSDGGGVACGYTIPKGADPLTWVVRLSASGTKLWDKTFTGAVHGSEAYAVCQAPDMGFAVLAPKATNEGGQYRESVRVIRLDKDGQVVWDKTISGKVAAAHAILAAPDGGFLLGGFANHQVGTSGQSAWVMKLDSQGNSVWERFLQGACAAEKSTALAPGPEGGCLIAYTACASGGGLGVARLDASGQVLWEKGYASTLGSGCSDVVKSLAPAPDGGFILSGGTGSVSRNGFLMRLDAQGNKLWDRHLGGGSAYAQPAEDRGVLAVCRRDLDTVQRVDLLVVKFDGQGKMLWARDLGEPGASYDVFGASRASPRGFFVTGYRMLSSTNSDLCVLRLDEEGSAGKPLRIMDPNPEPGIREDVFKAR